MITYCGIFRSNVNAYKSITASAKLNAKKNSCYVTSILQLCFYKKMLTLVYAPLAYVIGGL
jgi:hypothetical protein